ncbi:hypothetical protein ABZ443_22115, partial [Streptomyces shenzhenensis]
QGPRQSSFLLVRGTFCFPDRLPDNPLHESARLGGIVSRHGYLGTIAGLAWPGLARLRRDFRPIEPSVELVSGLQLLVGYRHDLISDRVQMTRRADQGERQGHYRLVPHRRAS